MRHIIAFSSPAGTTRRTAEMIRTALTERGENAELFDLHGYARGRSVQIDGPVCVWIGSPVYKHHPLPHCIEFMERSYLPAGSWCVPFVTWGGVSTGVALEELADSARAEGMQLAGGARVLCVHSSMWREENPPHADRPAQEEEAQLKELVDRVVTRIQDGEPCGIGPMLQRNPAVLEASTTASMEELRKAVPPPELDAGACDSCGLCLEACPVAAISLAGDGLPGIGQECIRCRTCVRSCPQGALLADMTGTRERLAGLIELFREPAETTIC